MREFRRTSYRVKEIERSNSFWLIAIIVVIFIGLILVLGFIISRFARKDTAYGGENFDVIRVIDGDTISVDMNGEAVFVRLIGINAPEIAHNDNAGECFGEESADHLRLLISNDSVVLEFDESQDRHDKYGRLLAYVLINDDNINYLMVRDGYADEYTYEKSYKYQTDFRSARDRAKNDSRGIWGACNVSKNTEDIESTTLPGPQSAETPQTTEGCLIKGNISYYGGKKIYHVPGQKYYDVTEINEAAGERWFCTEEEAIAAGWRKSKE